jgi:hypothetical protein
MTPNNACAALPMLGKWESSSNRRGNHLFLDHEALDRLFGAGIEAARPMSGTRNN